MTKPLFTAPQEFSLPLSKGGDLFVEFVYMPAKLDSGGNVVRDDQGNIVYETKDYPQGSTVTLTIEGSPKVVQQANISGEVAKVLVDHTKLDSIQYSVLWRLVLTNKDGIDTVIANGYTVRRDGERGDGRAL